MPCIVRALFHIPCPCCGCTRAMLSLLHGDVAGYCTYNAMALPLLIATAAMYAGARRGNRKLQTVGCLILFANIPYYLMRLCSHSIP